MSMKVSTKGRYGTRAMVNLALRYKEGPTFLRNIAKDEEISEKYLEQLFFLLRQAGLVKSERGAKGGYLLAKAPGKISLKEVLNALEGNFELVECIDNPKFCKRVEICATRDVWVKLKKNIQDLFSSITLDYLARCHKQKANCALEYDI